MKLELKDAIPKLKELLQKDALVLFAGSGMSIDSDIPNWEGLLLKYVQMAESLPKKDTKNSRELEQVINDAKKRIDSGKQLDFIQIATVLKTKIREYNEDDDILANGIYTLWVNELFLNKEPNIRHELIVSTDYPFILTSNYDLLFEKAAQKLGLYETFNSLTYKDELKIMSSIHHSKNCIIHVHGTANKSSIDELIFTKEDYNKMVLKKYEGFSFALRMVFTRYSTLFVGYGITDPHLEEVFEEITEYFPVDAYNKYPLPESYIVTMRKNADLILEKYKNRVRTNLIVIDNYDQYIDLLKELKNEKPKTKK